MTSVAIRDDERFLLISGDKFARLWNIQTGTDAWRTPVSNQARSVCFDEKGESVAVLSSLGEFVILDEATGHESRRGKLPMDAQIVFRANGEYLAAGAFGQVIRVFNLDGQELARVGQPQEIENVAFSSDGRMMATASYSGLPIVQMWQTHDLIETACRNLDRNLAQEEWEKYFAGESYRKTCPKR
jgi:WD40 repeat protein